METRFKSSKVQMFKVLSLFVFLSFELLNPLNVELALAQTNFYQGKTITMVVASTVGGGYDLWARLTARYIVKYIPGHPSIVVQNMRTDAPYKTLDDIRNASEPPRCSATGVGSSGYDIPRVLEDTLGLRFKVISGYPGGADQDLAMERGEVHCRAFTIDAFFGREPFPTWVKKGFVRVVMQMERKRHPKLADVPTIWELMDQYKVPESKRRLATVYLNSGLFGSRPIVSTPGLSAEQAKILRDAYVKTLKDPEFLDEIAKRGWTVDPVSGEDLQTLAKEVTSQPPEVVEWLKKLLAK